MYLKYLITNVQFVLIFSSYRVHISQLIWFVRVCSNVGDFTTATQYNIGLRTLLQPSISEPVFYGDLVYKFKRIAGNPYISDQIPCFVMHNLVLFLALQSF